MPLEGMREMFKKNPKRHVKEKADESLQILRVLDCKSSDDETAKEKELTDASRGKRQGGAPTKPIEEDHEEKLLHEEIIKEWEQTAMDAGILIKQSFRAKDDQ